jgi:precorrin-2/cobalt-factor-2 C20-methyltransferase
MTARLYGLGLGPGDPELVTLKALRLLRAVPVVAYPASDHGDSFARRIAAQWLDRGQREIAVRFPMRPGKPPAAVYRAAAAELAAALAAGHDVAYVCQGDPLLHGSFAGILAALPSGCPVTVVPGVSSPTACAAAAVRPLVQRDEVLSVVPATLAEDRLATALAASDAAAIIKLGRHLLKLRRVLDRLGLLGGAVYVEHATLDHQRVAPLVDVAPESARYFATVLVRRCGGE